MSKKTEHAQCIIEHYKRELSDEYKRHFSTYNRDFKDDFRRYYCFPYLYSALFYEPTSEQIRYIGEQAKKLEWSNSKFFLYSDKIMKPAPPEIGEVDFEKWKECSGLNGYYRFYRYLLIFGAAHPNGFFRKQCLKHFADDELYDMVSHTLIRLNDWVPDVRRQAMKTLAALMRKKDAAKDFIKAMPYIEYLRRSKRARRESDFSMDNLDAYLTELFENNAKLVMQADSSIRKLCYKVFSLHPATRYRGLMLYFFKGETDGELRCELERLYMKMSSESVPADVLELFMNDKYEHVRIIAYEYRIKKEGVWNGFEKLLFSDNWRIRKFAHKHLKNAGYDVLQFCRENLPQSLIALGDIGTEKDTPTIRPYLESHPCEAMYALAKLGAKDRKDIVISNMHSNDAELAKAAFRVANSMIRFEEAELLTMIKNEKDNTVQMRLIKLLTKDGIWKVMHYIIRFVRDFPQQRSELLYIIKDNTGQPVYITWEHNREIQAALGYAREANAIPSEINNQIFSDMKTRRD